MQSSSTLVRENAKQLQQYKKEMITLSDQENDKLITTNNQLNAKTYLSIRN